MARKIVSYFVESDEVFKTDVPGYSFRDLSLYSEIFRISTLDFWDEDEKRYFIPGLVLVDLLRSVVKKMYSENNNFLLKKINHIEGLAADAKEHRVYIEEDLIFQFVFRSKTNNLYLYLIEVLKSETKEIVLQGYFHLQ